MADDKNKDSTDPWLDPPAITALSDTPVRDDTFDKDAFGLERSMGPLYDILRHPKTETPLSIGIYGGWGSGKSTAMHWLEDRLNHWTTEAEKAEKAAEAEKAEKAEKTTEAEKAEKTTEAAKTTEAKEEDSKVKVYSTWFYPWKYDNKEDVWRGLIAEVMIACITKIKGKGAQTWTKMAKDVGGFLGKSFIHALSSVKLKAGAADISIAELMKVADEAGHLVDPSKPYLNEFETVLKNTVRDTLGNPEKGAPTNRLVVFIDDLDRCLPAIALQVLEALKLYLNIPDLVFVLGVDDAVVKQLIVKHYADVGVDKEKSQHYLSKMFQIEVPITVMEEKLKSFMESHIESYPSWGELKLSDEETSLFQHVIFELSGGVPREIKRLVNYALMAGRGEIWANDLSNHRHGDDNRDTSNDLCAADAVQLQLLRKALTPHDRAYMVDTQSGQTHLFETSQKIQNNKGASGRGDDFGTIPDALSQIMKGQFSSDPEIAADELITHLLHHPFPDPEKLSGRRHAGPTSQTDSFVKAAIEHKLDGPLERATFKDLETITDLDLGFSDATDISLLAKLPNLIELSLTSCPVRDLTPIQNLTALQYLYLSGTKVDDLTPIKNLTALQILSIAETKVDDLTPIKNLTALQDLYLNGTKVDNITPIQNLTALQRLYIGGTKVDDLTPIQNLSALKHLWLNNTPELREQGKQLTSALPNVNIMYESFDED